MLLFEQLPKSWNSVKIKYNEYSKTTKNKKQTSTQQPNSITY